MSAEACEVCEAIKLPQVVLFETSHWACNLAQDQTYLGRSYVTSKRHCGDLIELTPDEWRDLQAAMRKFETGMRKTFNARLFNWSCLMNNAFQSQNPQPHVHWHVRPRYSRTVTVAGEQFTDEHFGHHYERRTNRRVDDSVMRQIQKAFAGAV